jgi:uncharacterized protein YigE (DUF2233 family)
MLDGKWNFYLKPNGIFFYITDKSWIVAEEFKKRRFCEFATNPDPC